MNTRSILVPLLIATCALATARGTEPIFRILNGETLTLRDFHAFVGFEHRSDPNFENDRAALFQEWVVRAEAEKRGIEVRREHVEARFEQLDDEARRQESKSLKVLLEEQEVDREEFLLRLEATLLLERLVREEFEIDEAVVPPEKQNVWVQDKMARARIQRDELPPDLLARVDDRPVTLVEFGRRLVDGLSQGSPQRRTLEQRFLEAHAVRQYAEARGIRLTDADLDAEIARREKLLQQKPGMGDVDLDTVLAETGSSVADLRASLRFRTRVLLERLADEVEFKGADLRLFWLSHQAAFDELFGEQPILSTIFLEAGEDSARDVGFVPRNYERAEKDLENLKLDLLAGRGVFEEAAAYRSEHSSKDKKGLLGPVPVKTPRLGELSRRVIAARDRGELKIGDLYGPIRLVDGVHLVKVNGFVARKRFEEIAPEVRKYAMNELLRSIMAQAVVQ